VLPVQVKSLRKRMKEVAFARGVDRDAIRRCEEIGLELDELLGIGLAAMQGIAGEIGLA
jgi:predicted hydrolase (HD superfamily)